MIALTPQLRILVAREAIDFRKGIDGLASICRRHLGADPFSGTIFVFRNRQKTAIKLLTFDGQGYWLCHKRLSEGRFKHWPKGDGPASHFLAAELSILLQNGDPAGARMAPLWKKV